MDKTTQEIWQAGYDAGFRNGLSEQRYDRFQEAENLLECLEWLESGRFTDSLDTAKAYTRLKEFFEKRIEENA